MSAKDMEVIKGIAEGLTHMDDFEKGRILGRIEGLADAKTGKVKKDAENKDNDRAGS